MRQCSIAVIVSAFVWMFVTGLLADLRPEFSLYWGKLCLLGTVPLLTGLLGLVDAELSARNQQRQQARVSDKQQARRALRVRCRVALLANPKRA